MYSSFFWTRLSVCDKRSLGSRAAHRNRKSCIPKSLHYSLFTVTGLAVIVEAVARARASQAQPESHLEALLTSNQTLDGGSGDREQNQRIEYPDWFAGLCSGPMIDHRHGLIERDWDSLHQATWTTLCIRIRAVGGARGPDAPSCRITLRRMGGDGPLHASKRPSHSVRARRIVFGRLIQSENIKGKWTGLDVVSKNYWWARNRHWPLS